MVQSTQRITAGDPDGLHWQCTLLPATVQHDPDLCWASLTLQLQGQTLWQISAWPLVDLLSGLARIWPWLLLEEGYPIDINPEHIGHLMNAAQQRWSDLPANQAEAEENTLFDFRQRHDLSVLLRGINVPALWLLREGLDCQVWSPALVRAAYLSHAQVISSLQQLGDGLGQHMTKRAARPDCHPRATQALARWQQKRQNTGNVFLHLVTGLTQAEIDALQKQAGNNSKVMQEFQQTLHNAANDSAFAQANELQMAARMTRDSLNTTAQLALLQHICTLPRNTHTTKLDELCHRAPQLNVADEPYEQGYQLAYWLRTHLNLANAMPVNPDEILEQLGLTPVDANIPGPIDAAAFWGPNHGPAILVNQHSDSRASKRNGRRTTLAHEICHLLVDRNNALPVAEVLGGQVARRAEQRANAFAAELLLPRATAAAACSAQPDLLQAAQQLQQQYTVSREVVSHQIKNSQIGMSLNPAQQRTLDRWRNENVST